MTNRWIIKDSFKHKDYPDELLYVVDYSLGFQVGHREDAVKYWSYSVQQSAENDAKALNDKTYPGRFTVKQVGSVNHNQIFNELTALMGDIRPIPIAIAASYKAIAAVQDKAKESELNPFSGNIQIVPLLNYKSFGLSATEYIQVFSKHRLVAIETVDKAITHGQVKSSSPESVYALVKVFEKASEKLDESISAPWGF
ncbi:MAG: hypothetical protein AAF984_09630 [Verrucomicrobiota bacterium]